MGIYPGEDLTVEYTAVGNTVGLAQRMESLAEPGTVYVTAATARLVDGYFELRDLGVRPVKGMQDPLPVFELIAPGPLRTTLEVAAARGFSRFVGRDREMAVLEAALVQAADGTGQVVGVVAGPGVGKSRLCHEFAEHCRARGLEVFTAHGSAQARSVPFVPVLEILRAQFGIGERDDSAMARDDVARAFRTLDAERHDRLAVEPREGAAIGERAIAAPDPGCSSFDRGRGHGWRRRRRDLGCRDFDFDFGRGRGFRRRLDADRPRPGLHVARLE